MRLSLQLMHLQDKLNVQIEEHGRQVAKLLQEDSLYSHGAVMALADEIKSSMALEAIVNKIRRAETVKSRNARWFDALSRRPGDPDLTDIEARHLLKFYRPTLSQSTRENLEARAAEEND